jgi:hypothetical protein
MVDSKVKHIKETCYPCLMISDKEDIVLVINSCGNTLSGTLLKKGAGTDSTVGHYSITWVREKFKPFYGVLELSNRAF